MMNDFIKSFNTGYSIHFFYTFYSFFSGYGFLFPLSCRLFQSLNATCRDANLNYSWVGGCSGRGETMRAGIVKGRWAAYVVNLLVSGLWFVLLSQILSFRRLCFPGLWRVGGGQRR